MKQREHEHYQDNLAVIQDWNANNCKPWHIFKETAAMKPKEINKLQTKLQRYEIKLNKIKALLEDAISQKGKKQNFILKLKGLQNEKFRADLELILSSLM
jgi:predicted transcriptional regulator